MEDLEKVRDFVCGQQVFSNATKKDEAINEVCDEIICFIDRLKEESKKVNRFVAIENLITDWFGNEFEDGELDWLIYQILETCGITD